MRTRSNSHGALSLALACARACVFACLLACLFACLPVGRASAQEPGAPPAEAGDASRAHTIVAQIGGGGALSFGPDQTVPPDASESRTGLSAVGRVLWRPGHLLGIGLESGFIRVSSLETSVSDRVLHLTVVPAMVVFAMETGGFDASIATGWQRYIVSTEGRAISSAWEMSYSVAAGYVVTTIGGLGIGAEASYTALPERETHIVSLQLRAQYTIEY